jgi:uncharacterized protein with LGFP repeats
MRFSILFRVAAVGMPLALIASADTFYARDTAPGDDRPPMNDIQSEYQGLGGESSLLGAPLSQERALPDGRGRSQFFQRGAIYWTRENGAHVVTGPIRDAWVRDGAERSDVGYPVSEEQSANNGRDRKQYFEHGAIYWSPDQGARFDLNQQ